MDIRNYPMFRKYEEEGSGVRERPDGKKIEFTIEYPEQFYFENGVNEE
ncbi:MAG: hypothetical protein ACOC1K_05630 [Nanoarchaeota archaeon]